MKTVTYTGVGSRLTPDHVLERMREIGAAFARAGATLRSGGAGGADEAFEFGARYGGGLSELYLPWLGYNDCTSGIVRSAIDAEALARSVHPAWERLGPAAKRLHTRNVHVVLGLDLKSPSSFLICWTLDGCEGKATRTSRTGGTATAILIAERFRVPVFNLAVTTAEQRLAKLVSEIGQEHLRTFAGDAARAEGLVGE